MRKIAAAAAALGLAGALGAQSVLHSSAAGTPSWSQFHSDSNRDGALAVSGPTTHSALTAFTLQGTVSDSPVIAASGVGYIADDAGRVYALDPSKGGTPKWTVKPGGTVAGSPALSPDGTQLYIGNTDGNVYALKTSDGSTVWKTGINTAAGSSPLVSPDGATVYETTVGGAIYALTATTGVEKWHFSPQEGAAVTGAATSPDGSVVYFGTSNRFLYGVPATGPTSSNLATTIDLGGTPSATPAIDANGNIVVPEQEGTLELFAPTGGAPRWTYTVPGYQPIDSTPIFVSGLVVVAGASGYVFGVSESTGIQTWQTKIGPSVVSSPALATTNSRIYVGSNDGGLYALDPTGKILTGWPDQRNQGPILGSPALGTDGAVWYPPHAGYVYRVGDLANPTPPPAPPTSSPTPVFTSTPTLTPTPVATSTPTLTPTPTVTPTPVIVPVSIALKAKVKDGKKQVITITSDANTVVHIRVQYPNGDHQSHAVTTGSDGKATYSFKQGSSKVKHKSFTATVTATAGTGASLNTATAKYKIAFGNIDVSVEPRTQSVGKSIKIFVHAASGTRIKGYLQGPSGKVFRFGGRTGHKGYATVTYKVQSGFTKGSNRKVKVVANFQNNSSVATATNFTIK